MSWNLIKAIQQSQDVRLILPFGLNVKVGDVVSVNKNGEFTLQGTCTSLLGVDGGKPRPPVAGRNIMAQSGKDTTFTFRAAGKPSAFFADAPCVNAGFDIAFEAKNSWLLAVTGRTLSSLHEVDQFRRPILDAYRWKVWQPDWALITTVASADKMTLLASTNRNTKVDLALSGQLPVGGPLEAQFTAGASLVAMSQSIVQCIADAPSPAFCSGVRVVGRWFRDPTIGSLTKAVQTEGFWEDLDSGL
jgi:hypothetical protein